MYKEVKALALLTLNIAILKLIYYSTDIQMRSKYSVTILALQFCTGECNRARKINFYKVILHPHTYIRIYRYA